MATFVISDTHFNHTNIIKYCDRPFKNSKEMDDYIINQWNKTVTDEDIIIHCGDFAFADNDAIKNYVKKLKGKKILIMGNHDKKTVSFFESCGFEQVVKYKDKDYYMLKLVKDDIITKYIFSHNPLENDEIPEGYINYFGHIHNTELESKYNKDTHKCICVELIGYTPLRLN